MRKAMCLAAVFLALVSGFCSKKADVQADTEAIKALFEEWANNVRSANVEWFLSNYYADGALRLEPNQHPLEGNEVIRAAFQATFDKVTYNKAEFTVQDVKLSADLAVARGTCAWTVTPKTGGTGSQGLAKWAAPYQRQPDGSWRCLYDIWNSNELSPGTSEGGVEEKALIQLEQDWAEAEMKAEERWHAVATYSTKVQ